ncbi:MAG: type II secretion system major pseudopilin GspG [Mariniblastus sp.]|nr:type II secretion system major pseudopilin GspG [Mariniblastus sp.]
MRRNSHRRGRGDRRGFTLMELLLVMAILVIMASMVTFAFLQIQQNAQSDATLSQISTLESACMQYKLQVGRFPNTLDDLHIQPAGLTTRQWRGPFLQDPVPMDPWGNEYVYSPDAANNRVFISSAGPDGQQGSPDDVPEPNTQ